MAGDDPRPLNGTIDLAVIDGGLDGDSQLLGRLVLSGGGDVAGDASDHRSALAVDGIAIALADEVLAAGSVVEHILGGE